MGVISYALLAYGITAVISFMIVGIILGINKIFSKKEEEQS